jgi:hypothetical protein
LPFHDSSFRAAPAAKIGDPTIGSASFFDNPDWQLWMGDVAYNQAKGSNPK